MPPLALRIPDITCAGGRSPRLCQEISVKTFAISGVVTIFYKFYAFHCAMCSVLRIENLNQSWTGTLLILILDNCLQVGFSESRLWELLAGRYGSQKTNSLGLKINSWKMNFLLGWPIFRSYCSFRDCDQHEPTCARQLKARWTLRIEKLIGQVCLFDDFPALVLSQSIRGLGI